jgi:hypothetical protein
MTEASDFLLVGVFGRKQRTVRPGSCQCIHIRYDARKPPAYRGQSSCQISERSITVFAWHEKHVIEGAKLAFTKNE